ncbi:putative 2,3-bisphosphoglycerate-dependent phosphoglycerate mutase [metagenome]|uniref:phosphoglycerate mutase (2,3-diphosphoglycerate-dependent) n=1 Tax=metagenome TaxID=256318 RepID=A0A2P2C8V1_9ZZZZ
MSSTSDRTASLVLLRHGESEGNAHDVFTGWLNPPLTSAGAREARQAGERLRDEGVTPTVVYTSVLLRAIQTASLVMEGLGAGHDVRRNWRLNERHYGALQGLSRAEVRDAFGEDQLEKWRRSYDLRPPAAERGSRACGSGRRPARSASRRSESLADVAGRLGPLWALIVRRLRAGEVVLIVAHGSPVRILRQCVEGLTDAETEVLDVPLAVPFVYRSPVRDL